jgi:tetratricopeptide (TPR) repeat protein
VATVADLLMQAWQHHQAGDLSRAEQFYRQALRHEPNNVEAHNNLGSVLQSQGRIEEAVAHWEEALAIRPDGVEARVNLGGALVHLDRVPEALVHCEEAARQRPDMAEVQNNLGNVLAGLDHIERADGCYRQALRINPRFALAYNNLGNVLVRQDKLDEAVNCYRQAVQLQANYVEAHGNLGNAYFLSGRLDEAQASYNQALRVDSGDADTHFNQALLWLLQGKSADGWAEYEWRWRTKGFQRLAFRQPRWDGSRAPSSDSTLLLIGEQGLGDTLQFVRYASLIRERGWRIVLQCQAPLVRILAGMGGLDKVLALGGPFPKFDAYLPLLSIPAVFQTLPDTVPAKTPYLQADADLLGHWQRKLSGVRCPVSGVGKVSEVRCPMSEVKNSSSDIGLRTPDSGRFLIGIAWQGSTHVRADRQRSIPLARFARLAEIKGVQLISLQKGPGAEQLPSLTSYTGHRTSDFLVVDLGSEWDEASGAFMDTAAIMKNLDLVISSDTAVPHLAGALGVPVWVALPLVPDWRWLLQRQDTPWYPTMRLFRQTRRGGWDDVFERMAKELENWPRMRHG